MARIHLPEVLGGIKRTTELSPVQSLRKDHVFKLRKLQSALKLQKPLTRWCLDGLSILYQKIMQYCNSRWMEHHLSSHGCHLETVGIK